MNWASAIKERPAAAVARASLIPTTYPTDPIDWNRLVTLDFETYYDVDYTLSKLSTSEYIRDSRFKAQMVGIKIGTRATKVFPAKRVAAELKKIPWETHTLLCHNAQFDAFILSHHYGIQPKKIYCTLSMARGLHSNEIGAGLDEVSKFYGGQGKIEGGLEPTKGVLNWPPALVKSAGLYCANDVDECLRVFKLMAVKMPRDEMDLIDLTVRMFTQPVLKVDIKRVEAELVREILRREELMLSIAKLIDQDEPTLVKSLTKAERAIEGKEKTLLVVKKVVGSNERFADLLRTQGINPPLKISPAWMKKHVSLRDDADKYAYAFAKDDQAFTTLPENIDLWSADLNLNKKASVVELAVREARIRALVDTRIAVKSTTNITRAERFLKAGAGGMPLPCGYAYFRAHCLTGDAQVLSPTGWIRLDEWHGGEIAQWSENGKMKFELATPNVFDIDEDIIVAKSRYHSARYTKGHTIPAQTSQGVFRPRQAGTAHQARFALPISGSLHGSNSIDVLDVQLAVMVQADGSIRTNVADGRSVRFGFKKQRKIDRCVELLAEASVPFRQTVDLEGATRIFIGANEMHRLLGLLNEESKEFLPSILNASLDTKHAFINELTYWDGSVEPHRKGFTYSTTNQANAEMVQTLAHMTGQSAFVSIKSRAPWANCYQVYIRKDTTTRSCPVHYSMQHHTGKVYCPTTGTGFFLMKQDGHIVVTGNTGRWGGNNKMNMQNLTRGGELRQSILAPAGHQIAVADSGQIEARVNAWLWGQDDLLAAFQAADEGTGRDAYCLMGDTIYGRTITKTDATERFVGKVAVLGLGFQMGAPKLQMTLAKGALGGPPVYFALKQCEEIVNKYRRKNHRIEQGWRTCKRIIEEMAAGIAGSHKCLRWDENAIYLPNGMTLKYPGLKKALGDKGYEEWTYQSGAQRKKIYGGLLCENIVQALARIIVGWQMLVISRKYRVVMTTHDEVVACIKKAQASSAFTFMVATMRTPPAWCSSIPLNAEGGVADNYSK